MVSSLVDAHVHLWDLDRRNYHWLAELPRLNRTHDLKAFDRASGDLEVEQMVFVECTVSFDDEAAQAEVAWVQALAEEDPRLAGIVAHASLERGQDARTHLEWLAGYPLVKGVRRLLQDEPDPAFCLRPAFVEGVRMLAAYGFTFDVCVYPHQLPAVLELVERCPAIPFVLDHLGKPAIRDGAMDFWRKGLRALAACPNVVCKISGALTEADPEAWTPEQVRPYLDFIIEQFGFDRLMFGGDWPMLEQVASYTAWVALVRETVQGCSAEDQRKLFRKTAERVYRLG